MVSPIYGDIEFLKINVCRIYILERLYWVSSVPNLFHKRRWIIYTYDMQTKKQGQMVGYYQTGNKTRKNSWPANCMTFWIKLPLIYDMKNSCIPEIFWDFFNKKISIEDVIVSLLCSILFVDLNILRGGISSTFMRIIGIIREVEVSVDR